MAEYQALLRLKESVKRRIVPLFTVPPVEFDFEFNRPKKTVHEHVKLFPRRYTQKWEDRPSWIALDESIARGRMESGQHVFRYIFDRIGQTNGIPVLNLDADHRTVQVVRGIAGRHGRGIGLFMHSGHLMTGELDRELAEILESVDHRPSDVDLVLDLSALNYEPYGVFRKILIGSIEQIGILDHFRNFVLIGTAIPRLIAKHVGAGTSALPRHDWLFYRSLVDDLPMAMRPPVYGDHTTIHPDFRAVDLRAMQPSARILYTTPTSWATRTGGLFRRNPAQMHDHCAVVVRDPSFCFRGRDFCWGDEYIQDCADRVKGPSNLTTWKQVNINHHMTVVVDDVAKLAGEPSPV